MACDDAGAGAGASAFPGESFGLANEHVLIHRKNQIIMSNPVDRIPSIIFPYGTVYSISDTGILRIYPKRCTNMRCKCNDAMHELSRLSVGSLIYINQSARNMSGVYIDIAEPYKVILMYCSRCIS